MREVGVILDVTPTYSEANGGTIDLELKPQVVDEPIWKNYGMRIPFTGNTSSGTMASIGEIFEGMGSALQSIRNASGLNASVVTLSQSEVEQMSKQVVDSAMYSAGNVSTSSGSTMTWYDAPMEQPFFHVRSIDSKVSITPGSTVVMGGLITEARKAMDDKIPFLGDIPYLGRLFRSHAEQTVKRNLLIFVTGRLITPSGRELNMNASEQEEAEVKAAPEAK
jgi:type II secretory pathway component GspD/PulD (secretin)